MNDPRKQPGWKQLRHEEKLLLLLGAILDALNDKVAQTEKVAGSEPPPAAAATERIEALGVRRRVKKDS